jgi:hypothetical protein
MKPSYGGGVDGFENAVYRTCVGFLGIAIKITPENDLS